MRALSFFCCLLAVFCLSLPCMAFSVVLKEKAFSVRPDNTVTQSSARPLSAPLNTILAATHKEPLTDSIDSTGSALTAQSLDYGINSLYSADGSFSPSFSRYTTYYTLNVATSNLYVTFWGTVTPASTTLSVRDSSGYTYSVYPDTYGSFSTSLYVGGSFSLQFTTSPVSGSGTVYSVSVNNDDDSCEINCGLHCGGGTYCSINYDNLTCQCKLKGAVIAGIVIGAIVGLVIICVCVWACLRRRRNRDVYVAFNATPATTYTTAPAYTSSAQPNYYMPPATNYTQPTYGQPTYGQPATNYTQPAYGQPAYTQSQPNPAQYYVPQQTYQPPSVAPRQ